MDAVSDRTPFSWEKAETFADWGYDSVASQDDGGAPPSPKQPQAIPKFLGSLRPPAYFPPPFVMRQGVVTQSHPTLMRIRSAEIRLTGTLRVLSQPMHLLREKLMEAEAERALPLWESSTTGTRSPPSLVSMHSPQLWLHYPHQTVKTLKVKHYRDLDRVLKGSPNLWRAYAAERQSVLQNYGKRHPKTTEPTKGAPTSSSDETGHKTGGHETEASASQYDAFEFEGEGLKHLYASNRPPGPRIYRTAKMASYSSYSYGPSTQVPAGFSYDRKYYYPSAVAPNGYTMPATQTHTYFNQSGNQMYAYQPMPSYYGSYNANSASPLGGTGYHGPTAVQSHQSFSRQIQGMLHAQPLIIHTQILPEGVRADDPRLQHAKVVSERTYISDQPVLPDPAFTVTMHPSLISPTEPQNRLIRSDV